MKHSLKKIRPPTTPRLAMTITLTVLAGLLAALTGIMGNLASTTLPNALKPYLFYTWPVLGIIILLGIAVAAWQAWNGSGQPGSNSALPTPAPQLATQATGIVGATTPSQPTTATSSSQQSAQIAGATTAAQVLASGTTPAPSILPAPGSAHYHTCVISYSTDDEPFVTKLSADLKAHGVTCWLADQDGTTGNKLRTEIYQAIDQLDKLLLVLSKNAIESLWVEEEVDVALDREHQHPGTWLLFPVRLDDTVFTTKKYWAITVRQRRIGDFRQWQQDTNYQQALQRVLRDLRV